MSIYTDFHFSVAVSPQSLSPAGGISSHTVCACGRLVVIVCQVGRRGWHAQGIERGASDAGHWVVEILKVCGMEMERRMVG